jgi:hypothetical protein
MHLQRTLKILLFVLISSEYFIRILTILGDSFYWEFPNGIPSFVATRDSTFIPTVNYLLAESYQATLTAFSFKTGCSHSKTITTNIPCTGSSMQIQIPFYVLLCTARPTIILAPGSPSVSSVVCDKDSFDGYFNVTQSGVIGVNSLFM